ncbi:MAG: hypothetical protein K9G61_00220 [Bacteroidales bacterium]|nr:hypothetical protein [Bacteroidales bacterium]
MNLILKLFAVVVCIQALTFNKLAHGQVFTRAPGKNYVTAVLSYPFFRTCNFGYERMITKHGFVRINISRQTLSERDSYNTRYYFFIIAVNDKAKVFTSRSYGVGFGYFFLPKVGFYAVVDLTYRYRFYENKYHYDCVGTSRDSKVSLLSEYHNEYGVQNMAGIKIPIITSKGIRLYADFNLGVGFFWSEQKHFLIAHVQGSCSSSRLQYYEDPIETHLAEPTGMLIVRGGLGFNF